MCSDLSETGGNYVSVSSTLDSAVWPGWLRLFVPGPAGNSGTADLGQDDRKRGARPDGSADGQEGWAADLLYKEKEKQESGHTQRQEEEGGGQGERHKDQDVQ